MNRTRLRYAAMVTAILITALLPVAAMFGAFSVALADSSSGTFPNLGLKGHSGNVIVVNPDPVYIEYSGPTSSFDGFSRVRQIPLSYGDRCWMRGDSAYILVGRHGDRALVRSLQTMVGTLPDDAPPLCNDKVYFWVSATEFAQAQGEYAQAERLKQQRETPEERDKRVIRRLLDEQLARK